MKRIGIVGYGSIGKFLAESILNKKQAGLPFELAFVWNRSADKLEDGTLPPQYRMSGELEAGFRSYVTEHQNEPGLGVDMLVEVAHPDIVHQFGPLFLEHCDLFVSSSTALANEVTAANLLRAAAADRGNHGIYVPTGAGWGVADIVKLDALGNLRALKITMQFNARALRLKEPLRSKLEAYLASPEATDPLVLHDGQIRELAALAPNNVNTMVCLALAGKSVGLDNAVGCLIAHKHHDAHIVDIEVTGPDGFHVATRRYNPAKNGAVTGSQTYGSFLMSLLQAGGKGSGLHFC